MTWNTQVFNTFTVSGGVITGGQFQADRTSSGAFDRLYINVPIYSSGTTNYASTGVNNTSSIWNNNGLGAIRFAAVTGGVPEPATWAMMLVGFGAVGFAMRRRQTVTARVRFA